MWHGCMIGRSMVQSSAVLYHAVTRQVVHRHVPLFTKQYQLVPAMCGDAVKLGR